MAKPVCVVVGVGPGNGAAFTRRFAAAGYAVAMLARDSKRLTELAAALPDTHAYACDVSDAQAVERVFAQIKKTLGPVDVLIYNAGSGHWANVRLTSEQDFETAWRVNALGCLLAAQQVMDDMLASKHGCIVVIGATASLRGGENFTAFAAAKAAQRSLAQSMARHLGPQGIHVAYVVIDGVVDIPRTRERLPDKPEGFFLKPAHIADTVFDLTRQASSAWTFELDLRPYAEKW